MPLNIPQSKDDYIDHISILVSNHCVLLEPWEYSLYANILCDWFRDDATDCKTKSFRVPEMAAPPHAQNDYAATQLRWLNFEMRTQ